MRWIKYLLLAPVAAIGLFFLAWLIASTGTTHSHRFRVTVEVIDDGVVKTGSSVLETTCKMPRMASLGSSVRRRGEAIVVDLGPKGALVLTLWGYGPPGSLSQYGSGDGTFILVLRNLYKPRRDVPEGPCQSYDPTFIVASNPSSQGRVVLDVQQIPLLVHIPDKNLADARMVPRTSVLNPILGVALKSVTVALTTDRVTTGISSKLPFLDNSQQRDRLLGSHSPIGSFRLITSHLWRS